MAKTFWRRQMTISRYQQARRNMSANDEAQTRETLKNTLQRAHVGISLNEADIVALRDAIFADRGKRVDSNQDVRDKARQMLLNMEFSSVNLALEGARRAVPE